MRLRLYRRERWYGLTFLTRPRRMTQDRELAERSRFVYGPHPFEAHGPGYEGWWTTSIVGIVNGLLPRWVRIHVYVDGPERPHVIDGKPWRHLYGYGLSLGRQR